MSRFRFFVFWGGLRRPVALVAGLGLLPCFSYLQPTVRVRVRLPCEGTLKLGPFNPDFSSYFAPELAVRSKRQITKGIGNEEAVEWKTVCVSRYAQLASPSELMRLGTSVPSWPEQP